MGWRGLQRKIKGSKYNNRRTKVDGITFDSMREAARYLQLKALLKVGAIRELECHRRWPLILVTGEKICDYESDFSYADMTQYKKKGMGIVTVEDVKGVRTPVYKLKKKLFEAIYKIKITEL